jgi:hypothetical protein
MRIRIKKLKTKRIMMYLTCQEGEKKKKKNKRPLVTIRPLHITTHQTMWKRTRWRMQGEAERLDLATG